MVISQVDATNVPTDAVESARKKLEHIEGYVIVTTILMAFLVVFGSCRRRSHNKFLIFSISIAYLMPMYLITYTLGQMQSATFRNELFTFWAMFLLIFLGSADCISAYRLEDNENRKRYNLEVMFKFYILGWFIATYAITKFLVPLYILCLLKTFERGVALTMASRSYGLVRINKLIADFMAYEHMLSNEDEVDPVSMKGFKYLVKGEEKEQEKVVPPQYQNQLQLTGKAITIDMIWQCEGRLLSSNGDPDGRLKDICLSYALYRLLCRRFAGYHFSESSQVKTWNFVRYGLLSNEDDHERAFRVIEVELEFLYDLFYTKYAVFSDGLPKLKHIRLILVIISCVAVAAMLRNYHAPIGDLNLLTVGGHNVDVLVTGIVVVAILFMELVQYFVVSFSNWAKVQWLCCYVVKPSWQKNKLIEKILQIVCHRKRLKPWGRKLGQYSLLESFNYSPSRLLYNLPYINYFVEKPRKGQKESNRINLPMEVKKAISISLKTNGQHVKNGEASLQRNGVENELSWACRLETQTHVIMVWHIATSLCEIDQYKKANLNMESEHFIVANALSKYCAYLVAFVPSFLPDHSYITEVLFDQVVQEARDVLNGCDSPTGKYEKMMTICEGDPAEKIITRGAALAKHLIVGISENDELRWKILADFWAEMMLFVTPSNETTVHAEYLARGGEFVTHLWALLSHAGILKRDSSHEDV
ncbi:hypothetical protein FCV25MIE_32202 [Fagus crenata]